MNTRSFLRACLVGANRACAPLDRPFGKYEGAGKGALFIVGLPRSGTTLAYELLVQALDVAYLTKLYNYTFGLPNLTTRLLPGPKRPPAARYESKYGRIPGRYAPAENHHLWSRWFAEDPRLGHHVPATLIAERDALAMNRQLVSLGNIAGLPFIFKDIYLTLSVDAVLQHLPGSRVLVITRDEHAVAASVHGKRARDGNVADWWSLRPPFADTVANSDLVEQVAFQCVRSRQVLEKQLSAADPNRYRVMDYADICRSPRVFIDEVKSWLGTTFAYRDAPDIPDGFDIRPSVGFPDAEDAAYREFAKALGANREAYLASIERTVAARRTGHTPVPGDGF